MKKILLMVAILSALVMIIPTSGCSGSTRVGDILANPMNFEGKQVSIRGTVGETVWLSFLKKGAYQIGDGSGTIWIVTPQPPPQKGTKISTKGTVSTAFKLEDRTLGTVITEVQRD